MTLILNPDVLDEQTIAEVVRFHGHQCPGLAIGIQAARLALREIGCNSPDEEVVAVVETDMCAVDAIQFMTGCTFGKGNLIHRNWGKNAYTFFRRADDKAVRIAPRPRTWMSAEQQELQARARAGDATEAEQARLRTLRREWTDHILTSSPDELFTVTEVQGEPPHQARLHSSVECTACGEDVMETRTRKLGGRDLCIPCWDAAYAVA
jgi:formylmethanofuran dehydrogenase subunit E